MTKQEINEIKASAKIKSDKMIKIMRDMKKSRKSLGRYHCYKSCGYYSNKSFQICPQCSQTNGCYYRSGFII